MPEFTITVSDEGLKAIEAADGGGCYSFQEWIQNAASQQERRSMDFLVEKFTCLNYKNASISEKKAEILKLSLETAKERTDRFKREMKKKPI